MEVNSKSLDSYSREELIKRVGSLEEELTRKQKKFGLVWEDKTEKVVADCDKMLPVLTEVEDKVILKDTDSDATNLIIEGDNYHALSVLNYTHAGKIDTIYIDPPYNTGNKDFVYDDCYVDAEDSFRHSKWLCFMERRLGMAKNLLKNSGVIFISIDDNEYSQLRLLCDEIFGEENFLASLPRITKRGGKSSDIFAKNNDYILCYAKCRKASVLNPIAHDDEGFQFKDEYYAERGAYKLNQTLDYNSLGYSNSLDYPIELNGMTFLPGGDEEAYHKRKNGEHRRADWAWRWSKELFRYGLENGFIVVKSGGKRPRIYTKTYQNATIRRDGNKYAVVKREQTKALSTLETTENIYSNDNAKKELDAIIGKEVFDYPKPTTLIKLLTRLGSSESGVILDFFAGSGTTGQAVMELNKEDGGKRQFILCTNNENRIAEDVTYPRIKTVVTGKRIDGSKYSEGLLANVRYFRTDFVEKGESTDETRERLILRATDIIRVKEGTFEAVLDEAELKVFTNGATMTAVIFEPFQMSELWQKVEKVNREKLETHLYIFSYSSDVSAFTDEISETEINWVSKPIPDGILKVYKKLFE